MGGQLKGALVLDDPDRRQTISLASDSHQRSAASRLKHQIA
jgi:hypothetical protein